MSASDVTERPDVSSLNKNRTFGVLPQCQPRFENDVRPGLWGCFPFIGGIINPQEFIPEPGLVIAGEEHDNGLRILHSGIQNLAHKGRRFPGQRDRFAPFDGLQINGAQEIEESPTHLLIATVDDENPGFIQISVTFHYAATSWMVFSELENYHSLSTRRRKSPGGGFHGGF